MDSIQLTNCYLLVFFVHCISEVFYYNIDLVLAHSDTFDVLFSSKNRTIRMLECLKYYNILLLYSC
jgi:hypothetical protein